MVKNSVFLINSVGFSMVFKKNKKFIIFLLSWFFIALQAKSMHRSIEDIQKYYQPTMSIFHDMKTKDLFKNYDLFHKLFLQINVPIHAYLKQLRIDCSFVKKMKKKENKEGNVIQGLDSFYVDLYDLQSYLKRHRLQLDVLEYHALLDQQWGDLLVLISDNQDILPNLSAKGIKQEGVKGLKSFIKKMEHVLRKIDEYEYRLHSDWTNLKLANYIVKIEIIRLRNAAIFHPLYKGMSLVSSYPR